MQKLVDAYELEREMFRRCIYTDEEIKKGRAKWDSGLWIRYKVFEDAITLAQRVDAVEVVRCKDCEYWDDMEKVCVDMMMENSNGYCSYGKRRKEDEL